MKKIEKLFISVFICFLTFCEGSELFDSEKPFVSHHPRGQLGNQLFQASAGLSCALDHDAQYILPLKTGNQYPEVFWRFPKRTLPDGKRSSWNHEMAYNKTALYVPINYQDNLIIHGFFLSYKYFDHHREKLLELFAPSDKIKSYLNQKYTSIFQEPIKVGVHIRTYLHPRDNLFKGRAHCKIFYSKLLPPDPDFIKKAMDHFPDEALFVICTDNLEWTKRMLKGIEKRIVFVSDSVVNDFYLLTLCDHNIIGNSTFGWWAAYLNTNPEKIVVAPSPYRFRPGQLPDIYPPDWVLIEREDKHLLPVMDEDKLFIHNDKFSD
ncbi:MAG: alpha-1,2-fucosyltransferase [Simkaniaceae bacterium]